MIRKIFEDLCSSLQDKGNRLEKTRVSPGGDPDAPTLLDYSLSEWSENKFQEDFVSLNAVVYSNCNKLALGFSSLPFPNKSATEAMVKELEASIDQVIQAFYGLTREVGAYFITDIHQFCTSLVVVTHDFAECIRNSISLKSEARGQSLLTEVGKVWERIETGKKLPPNNLQACLSVLRKERKMIADALSELAEAVQHEGSPCNNEDFDEDDTQPWTGSEREILEPAMGLIKTTDAIIKKIYMSMKRQGDVSTKEHCEQLSLCTDIVKRFSGKVDDLAMNLYAPQDTIELMNEALFLRADAVNLLDTFHPDHNTTHFISTADYEQWGDFLTKAMEHNYSLMADIVKKTTLKEDKTSEGEAESLIKETISEEQLENNLETMKITMPDDSSLHGSNTGTSKREQNNENAS